MSNTQGIAKISHRFFFTDFALKLTECFSYKFRSSAHV